MVRTLGRLAYKEEPGKVRVFAMVDCWTQWVLNSLHEWIFNVLRHIPQDGTFNQDQAVTYLQTLLKDCKCAFSYDLSAATDRLPLSLQILLLNSIGKDLGTHWANLLVNRDYFTRPHKSCPDIPKSVRYAAGQPMGALSSWAMLALTHHFVVQLAAYKVGFRGWFPKYVVLGDDVVITDIKVAKEYYNIMTLELAVDINLSKSIKSTTGFAEFAKRLVNSTDNLSGISLKEFESSYLSWSSVISLIKKFNPSEYYLYRFLGRGSKSAGNAAKKRFPTSLKFIDNLIYRMLDPDSLFANAKIIGGLNYYVTGAVLKYKEEVLERVKNWGYFKKTVLKPLLLQTGLRK